MTAFLFLLKKNYALKNLSNAQNAAKTCIGYAGLRAGGREEESRALSTAESQQQLQQKRVASN